MRLRPTGASALPCSAASTSESVPGAGRAAPIMAGENRKVDRTLR